MDGKINFFIHFLRLILNIDVYKEIPTVEEVR